MGLVITDDLVAATGWTELELRREIAILLFQQVRLSLGQASRLAGINQYGFQCLLISRQIPLHYGSQELADDVKTLRDLGLLRSPAPTSPNLPFSQENSANASG